MIYPHTDVLCCFPGIGRTTFSSEQNKGGSTFCLDMDYDGTNLKAFIDRVKAERDKKAHRYILVPLNENVRKELSLQNISFITVTPYFFHWDAWAKRWMKAGATADVLLARLATWNAFYLELNLRDEYGDENATVHLSETEWLGNVLEQAPATQDERRDV